MEYGVPESLLERAHPETVTLAPKAVPDGGVRGDTFSAVEAHKTCIGRMSDWRFELQHCPGEFKITCRTYTS